MPPKLDDRESEVDCADNLYDDVDSDDNESQSDDVIYVTRWSNKAYSIKMNRFKVALNF